MIVMPLIKPGPFIQYQSSYTLKLSSMEPLIVSNILKLFSFYLSYVYTCQTIVGVLLKKIFPICSLFSGLNPDFWVFYYIKPAFFIKRQYQADSPLPSLLTQEYHDFSWVVTISD